MQDFIRIHENDNVAVALRAIRKGETIAVAQYLVTAAEEIPQGHKIAFGNGIFAYNRHAFLRSAQ